jgi:hypothetical protein
MLAISLAPPWLCNNALLTRTFQRTSSSIPKIPHNLALPNVMLTSLMLPLQCTTDARDAVFSPSGI